MSRRRTTRHAEARMRQRGLRDADLELALDCATQVASDAYMLTDADAARAIAARKKEIQQLERLRGVKIVVEGDVIVTCMHARPAERKRMLRNGRASR